MNITLPESRNAVIDFICLHEASESHYRRAQTKKKYFDAYLSLRKMWGKFVSKNPSFKTNRSKMKNKGPVISFSTFRNIFIEELRDVLSFRKAREDTCQYCDEVLNKIDNLLEKPHGRLTHAVELDRLREEHNQHRRESGIRFASLKYDINFLSKR